MSSRPSIPTLGLIFAFLLLSGDGDAQAPPSETLTFAPAADTFVESSSPSLNYDADTRLRADADPVRLSYLRFVVGGVAGRQVVQTRLRLYVTGPSGVSGGRVHRIGDTTWNAATLTYQNRPAIDGPVLSTLGSVAGDKFVEFDLADAVTSDGVYSFAIDSTSTDGVTYASTAATGSQRPALVLTVAGGAAPVVSIVQPPDGASFFRGDPVALQAEVTDDADTDLAAAVLWRSSLAGDLGTGGSIAPRLGDGEHAITATVTDSDGLTGADEIRVSVVPPPPVNTEPLVTITAPLDGRTFTSADPIPFRGAASDLEDGDLSAGLSWRSTRDGLIGSGASFAARLSAGSHDVTASVTDGAGLAGSATTHVRVVAPAPLQFPPVADAYVSSNEPDRNLGTANDLRLDIDPERIAYLRFVVTGVGTRRVTRATLRMQVAQGFFSGSDTGGIVHRIGNSTWNETTVTYRNRPAIDGPVLASAGAVAAGQTVEFDVTAAVAGDGSYNFALRTPSNDSAIYTSREVGGPLLTLVAEGQAPVVTITRPTDGVEVSPAALPVRFEATAVDVAEGDLGTDIVWESDRDGLLGVGASLSASLSEARHRIVARVTNAGGVAGRDEITVTVTPTPPTVTILQPRDGTTVLVATGATFSGTAQDPTEGDLSSAIVWTSSRDGRLGSGRSLGVPTLSEGTHVISAAARDANGLEGRAQITITARVGNAPPVVAIVTPVATDAFLAGEPLTLRATALDPEEGDLAARVQWTSSRDGVLAAGNPLTLATLSPGSHTLTAGVADAEGAVAVASVSVRVADTTMIVDVQEDTYVDAALPSVVLGAEPILTADASPVRETYLRFAVRGVPPFAVTRAVLRLTVGRESSHASSAGGSVRALTDTRWSETSTTYATRPRADGPVLFKRGSVAANAVVDFDTTAAVFADGVYDFALSSGSSDAASYRSREAGTGAPRLVLTLARNTAPAVRITAPAPGSVVLAGAPVALTATATDAEDGDLGRLVQWRSDRDGPIGTGTTLSTTRLGQGAHTVTAEATDSSGAAGVATIELVVDAPPAVTIVAPRSGSIHFTDEQIGLGATAIDVLEGDLRARIVWTSSLDGALGTGASLGARLRAGAHIITAAATDARGLTGSESVAISVEVNDPPTVRIAAPAEGAHSVAGAGVLLAATASDPEEGDLSAQISWASDRAGALGSGASLTTTRLGVGAHRLEAAVADRRGLRGTAAVTVSVEANDPPLVAITQPAEGSVFHMGTMVLFAGSATDPEDGDLSARLAWRSDQNGVLGSGTTLSTTALRVGRHRITAAATDTLGLEGSTFRIIDVVNDAPVVIVSQPPSTSRTIVGNPVVLRGSATDTEDGDLGATLMWTSSRDGLLGRGSMLELTTLTRGTHTITARVTDVGGAAGTRTISLTVDPIPTGTGAPTVTIVAPAPGTVVSAGTPFTLTGTAVDPDDGDIGAAIVWTSDRNGSLGTGRSIVVEELSVGTHRIRASVTDTRGVVRFAEIPLEIIPGAPEITILLPEAGAGFLAGVPIGFYAEADDALDGDVSPSLVWTSDREGLLGTGRTFVADTLGVGVHTIMAAATNTRGLVGSAEVEIVVSTATVTVGASADTYVDQGLPDTAFGSATALLADAGPNVREAYLRFAVGGTDALRLDRARLRLVVGRDGRSDFGGIVRTFTDTRWTESATTYLTRPVVDGPAIDVADAAVDADDVVDFDVTGALAGDGSYDFAVVSSSEDGVQYRSREAASGRPQLVLQLGQPHVQQIPEIRITAPATGLVVFDDQAVTFRAVASDPEDGDLSAAIAWRSNLDGTLGGGPTLSRRLGFGTHTVSATVRDAFGLQALDTVAVTVVDRPPAVSIAAPATGTYVPDGYPLRCTASAVDDVDGDLSARIEWTSDRDGFFGRGASVTTDGLSRGDHRITASAVNGFGTVGTASIVVVVDQAAPEVAIFAPESGASVDEGARLGLAGAAIDLEDGDLSHAIVWRSDLEGLLGTGAGPSAVLATVGTHRIIATATDSHGFTRSVETSVLVVPAGPVVTIAAPADGGSHVGPVTLAGSAIDARDGDLSRNLRWISNLDGPLGTGAQLSNVALRPGLHAISASATDTGGRIGSASIDIAVGVLSPVVEILAPVGADATTAGEFAAAAGEAVIFSGRAIDAVGADLTGAIRWSSDLAGALGTGGTVTAPSLPTGRHRVSAVATDRNGFTGSARIIVVVDVPAGGTGYAGGGGPRVDITAPASGAELTADAPFSLRATALDRLGTDVAPAVGWSSSREGFLGEGATLATSLHVVGAHSLTATVADATGLVGSDTVTVTVTAPSMSAPAIADAYIDAAEPSMNFGAANELRVDGSPLRESYLRFAVTGVAGRTIRRAVVRLQTASVSTAGGTHAGAIHLLSGATWQELTVTAANRPTVAGAALATVGAVIPSQTVDFDVTAAVRGDGTYEFVLRPGSSDVVIYRSREAAVGQPALLLFFDPPPLVRPSVDIVEPAPATVIPVGAPVRFRATASDPQDGDISVGLLWASDVDGLLARGPSATLVLSPGPHVITARANDVHGHTGADRVHVLVGDAPLVEITSPAGGTSRPFGERVVLAATAFDPQDGDLSFSIEWESDLDGSLGMGPAIAAALGPGLHTVTARVADRAGGIGSAAIAITMTVGDVGFRDLKFGANVDEDTNRITGAKPESKLWHLDGIWWGTLFAPTAGAYSIHRLDIATQKWIDTRVPVDERPTSRQDALLVGETLYMASRTSVPGGENRLLRYTYRRDAQTFVRNPGFPVTIPGGGTEALTLTRDSTGTLWIAFTLNDHVMVSHTLGSDGAWAAPFVVPVTDENPAATHLYFDDIAAVQRLDGAVGVFWSNQLTQEDYFAVRRDGTPPADPAAWRLEVAATGGAIADDHLNMKLASDGRLFVAVKTNFTRSTATLIGLLVRSPAGVWSGLHHVATAELSPTRPLCLLDEVRRRVHVFYSPLEAAIYTKSSDMDVIAFPDPDGIGTPFIASAATGFINNPTSTKQNVDPATGLVVLAASTTTYWHNSIDPETAPAVTITAPADGLRTRAGTSLTFTATAFSIPDGVVTDRLAWTSSLSGRFGTGARVSGVVLPEGEHVITAALTDSSQATGRDSVRLTVARDAPPVVTISEPASGRKLLHGTAVTLAATAIDALAGNLSAAIAWTSDRDGSLGRGGNVTEGTLSPGQHVLTAAATNAKGLTGRASVGVDVQRPEPPVIRITAPAADTVADFGAAVGFAGTAIDAFDGDVTERLRWHSSRDGAIGVGRGFSRTSLSFGLHFITATATDSHGLVGSAAVAVMVDDLPSVTITSPAEGSVFVEGEPVMLTAVASDPQDGDVTASVAWHSATDGPLGGGGRITASGLSPGEQVITATATDRVGGQRSATRRLRIRGKPRVRIMAPADGASVDPGGPVTLTATATDTEDGDLGARTVWTADIDGALGTGARITTTALATRGAQGITASVTDSEGFVGTHRISVYVNAAPAVTIVTPANGAAFTLGQAIALEARAVDPEDGDRSADVVWASDADGALGAGSRIVVSTLSAGFHNITAAVADSRGRTASAGIRIFVDGVPRITIIVPGSGAVLFANAFPMDFIAEARDVAGNDIGASVAWSSDVDGALGTGARIRPSRLTVGGHTITARATDGGGRTSSATVGILVRPPNVPPQVTITAPAAGATAPAGTALRFAATASDDFDGDLGARVTWASDVTGNLGTGAAVTVTLREGVHRITARAVDGEGAADSATITVTIAPTPPAVTILAPVDGSVIFAGQTATLRGTALDATDGDRSAALLWSSDRAGSLGTGGTVSATLGPGSHTITASVTDAGGLTGSARVTLVVDALPAVSIAAPAAAAPLLSGRPVVLAALAVDPEDGDVTASVRWESSRDGVIGSGPLPTVSGLSAGAHTLTARATDRHGGSGSATVTVDVVAALRTIVASADTYVDAGAPNTAFGQEDTFRIDADPIRQGLLRFTVADPAPFSISAATLRLTVGSLSSHAGDSGGTLHSITGGVWSETTTFTTRPVIDGPALGTAGAVDTGDTVRFDVGTVVTRAGAYDFALVTSSTDGVGYRSREASKNRPTLELSLM